jgi:acetylornithine deacetylase
MGHQEQILSMSNHQLNTIQQDAIGLLKQLIAIPSFSKDEAATATCIQDFLIEHGVVTNRYLNNVWATNQYFDITKPTILLNSHHDTVKPNKGYTLPPFEPIENEGKLFGLGSNDAGGCLVSLVATFLFYYNNKNLKYNLLLAATAEEEISGNNGVEILLPLLPKIDFGIVGEPTLLNMAVAERGLMVLDCVANGKAGHAARSEGENAIYKAFQAIDWLKNYKFEKVSDLLGEVKMTVTSINTENKQHNVVPPQCSFIVDVRVNELYTFDDVINTIQQHIDCTIQPRSCRLKSTAIDIQHPIIQSGIQLGKTYYGSPTTSDKALMNFPTLKMGPGDSARSHTADEFIFLSEIETGIETYIQLLYPLLF